ASKSVRSSAARPSRPVRLRSTTYGWTRLIDTNAPVSPARKFRGGDAYKATGRSLLMFERVPILTATTGGAGRAGRVVPVASRGEAAFARGRRRELEPCRHTSVSL